MKMDSTSETVSHPNPFQGFSGLVCLHSNRIVTKTKSDYQITWVRLVCVHPCTACIIHESKAHCAHTHNPNPPKAMTGGSITTSSSLAWATWKIPGHPRLHRELVSEKTTNHSEITSFWQSMSVWGHKVLWLWGYRKDLVCFRKLTNNAIYFCTSICNFIHVYLCIWPQWEHESTPTPQRTPSCIASAPRSSPHQVLSELSPILWCSCRFQNLM